MDDGNRQLGWGSAALLAAVAAALLYASNPLAPCWWAPWLVSAPLLWLALQPSPWAARGWVVLALLGLLAPYISYFQLLMPWPAVALVSAGSVGIWLLPLMAARRVIRTHASAWSGFALPLFSAAVDTLMTALLPDGNWGSLAYTQANAGTIPQLLSLAGVPGLLFVLTLPASAVAVWLWGGRRLAHRRAALGTAAVVLIAACGYGLWYQHQGLPGPSIKVGLVSIDDPIDLHATPGDSQRLRDGYDALVQQVAAAGAQLMVLPEKIAVFKQLDAPTWQQHFSQLAIDHHAWIELGVGIDEVDGLHNHAWLIAPSGALLEDYQKHYMAPPERAEHYVAGHQWSTRDIAGIRYGLAICKDMHFAPMGLAYGQRDVAVMLVPSWDFAYRDAWLASRMAIFRGIENGYAVIRSSREGLLTVSDAHGHIFAETRSAGMPGHTLLANLELRPQLRTWYTRGGYAFGWLCVVLGGWMLWRTRRLRAS